MENWIEKEDIEIWIDNEEDIAWRYFPSDELDEEDRQSQYYEACLLAHELITKAQPNIVYMEVDQIADLHGWRWVLNIMREGKVKL